MVQAMLKLWHSVADPWLHTEPASGQADVEYRLGEYYVDYTPVTPEEVAAVNAETDAFLKNCKRVSQ